MRAVPYENAREAAAVGHLHDAHMPGRTCQLHPPGQDAQGPLRGMQRLHRHHPTAMRLRTRGNRGCGFRPPDSRCPRLAGPRDHHRFALRRFSLREVRDVNAANGRRGFQSQSRPLDPAWYGECVRPLRDCPSTCVRLPKGSQTLRSARTALRSHGRTTGPLRRRQAMPRCRSSVRSREDNWRSSGSARMTTICSSSSPSMTRSATPR